jgi:Fe-Mn family superoxide dismutase
MEKGRNAFAFERSLRRLLRMAKKLTVHRRDVLKTGLLAGGSLGLSGLVGLSGVSSTASAMRPSASLPRPPLGRDLSDLRYPFSLPDLPFATSALAPAVDEQTMEIHHGKHHAGYVRKLNAALEAEPSLQKQTLGELLSGIDAVPASVRTAVRRNGGGHANHALYWSTIAPQGTAPSGAFAQALETAFGGLGGLEAALKTAALGQFGSGWAWLVLSGEGGLEVMSTANQDSPAMQGLLPLFGIDVWEHAYYLNYQNRRGAYVDAFLQLADWQSVSEHYAGLV